jgi:hypothetical protein
MRDAPRLNAAIIILTVNAELLLISSIIVTNISSNLVIVLSGVGHRQNPAPERTRQRQVKSFDTPRNHSLRQTRPLHYDLAGTMIQLKASV